MSFRTYTKAPLSGSTHGKGIKIGATSTPGTLLHTAVNSTSDLDEIWCWVSNLDSVARTITLEWGGTTDPDDLLVKTTNVQANSAEGLLVPGLVLRNNLVVRAFASSANVLIVSGFVNQIRA